MDETLSFGAKMKGADGAAVYDLHEKVARSRARVALPRHGAPERRVGAGHKRLVLPEQGELQLRLRLVQEELVHLDAVPPRPLGQTAEARRAHLGPVHARREDLGERRLWER